MVSTLSLLSDSLESLCVLPRVHIHYLKCTDICRIEKSSVQESTWLTEFHDLERNPAWMELTWQRKSSYDWESGQPREKRKRGQLLPAIRHHLTLKAPSQGRLAERGSRPGARARRFSAWGGLPHSLLEAARTEERHHAQARLYGSL